MSDVLTVTVNSTLDITAHADRVEIDTKIRCTSTTRDPGGGGINVARAIGRLGGEATALWTRGGLFGDEVARLMDTEGVDHVPIDIGGETRLAFAVLEEGSQRQFRFSAPGPELTHEELEAIRRAVSEGRSEYLVLSGGLALGAPPDFYATLASTAARAGGRVVLDTHGEELKEALAGGDIFLVKPNYRELAHLVGKTPEDEFDVEAAARSITERHSVAAVVVSLGKAGAILVTADTTIEISAPTVPIKSRIGAGDSMVGGMVYQLARGAGLETAARFGVATGSAAVMTGGTELCHLDDVERLVSNNM